MSTIAIITARGGSKRIPKKNIKEFMGKPMIAYAISSCLDAGIFDEVMVSTDSREIANVAVEYGAQTPFMRSEKTSDDYATTYDVLEEVIAEYGKRGREFKNVCCVYPCVPFLNAATLKDARSQFEGNDALLPVCKHTPPIEWAMRVENGILVPNERRLLKIRSQDIEPKYFDVGMFYFCKTSVLLKEKTLIPQKAVPYLIDVMECQDIDTYDDWKYAEMKYKILHDKKAGSV